MVYPSSADQVSQAIKAATGQGLSVAARGGGHSYAALGLGGEDNAFVIDLSNMADISVDGSSKIGYIGGGARLGDVALALNDAGRGMPHGSCPYVGVGGHFALGGFGFQSVGQTPSALCERQAADRFVYSACGACLWTTSTASKSS